MDILLVVYLWIGFAVAVSALWLVVVMIEARRVAKEREEV